MKITSSRSRDTLGSALLATMVLGGILCMFVVYYLSLIEQQNKLSVRSQAWNMAIAVTEAGIEEGLEQLNSNTLNLTTDPLWSYDGLRYWRTNTMPDGNSYTVYIDISTDPFHPIVVARSYVTLPKLVQGSSSAMFAVLGGNTGSATVNRAVRVQTARGSLFIKAMVAKHRIDMNGNDIAIDSFDSRDLWHSWFGHYQASTAKDGGDVATNDSLDNSLTTGNANVYGHTSTGPGGHISVGSQGAVGEHSWQPTHQGQIETGWFADNSNFTFPEPTLPYTNGLPPTAGPLKVVTTTYNITGISTNDNNYPAVVPWSGVTTNWVSTRSKTYPAAGTYIPPVSQQGAWYYFTGIDTYSYTYYNTNTIYTTNTYDQVLPTSGDYIVNSLSGNTLIASPNTRLVITGGLSMKGNDLLVIAPGASAQVYCGGTSCTIGGNGVINQSGYAANFVLYCTPSVSSFTFNGNGEFTGVLVAPDAHVDMNGGGKTNNDFIGAIIMDSIKMNGHFSFHYDEALGVNKGNGRMLITSWDEIP